MKLISSIQRFHKLEMTPEEILEKYGECHWDGHYRGCKCGIMAVRLLHPIVLVLLLLSPILILGFALFTDESITSLYDSIQNTKFVLR